MTKEEFIKGIGKKGFEEGGEEYELYTDGPYDLITISINSQKSFKIYIWVCTPCVVEEGQKPFDVFSSLVDKCKKTLASQMGEEPIVNVEFGTDEYALVGYEKEFDLTFVDRFISATFKIEE